MKSSGLLCLCFLFLCWLPKACEKEKESWVDIPDAAFLQALIDHGADRDSDGRISRTEAGAIDSLRIGPRGIADLSGLSQMPGLQFLEITLNPITALDLSGNRALLYLACTSCELDALDVSGNPLLQELHCGRNALTELDVSNNTDLLRCSCNNNLLVSLDVSRNTKLEKLITCGNRLRQLDLSQNRHLSIIGIDNMPMLEQVCVWILPFPPEDITLLVDYSPNVQFTVDCAAAD